MSDGPVLYVLKRWPRLSETFILNELLELEAAGERLSIDALLPPEDEPRHPEVGRLRATVRYLPRHPRLRRREVALAHLRVAAPAPLRWVRLARRARRRDSWRRFLQAGLAADRIRRDGVRHVHAHFATAAAEVARDAAQLAGVPVTVTCHGKDIWHRENAPELPQRLAGVSAVVTVSEFNARHLRSCLPGIPVHHVPNGIAPAPQAANAPSRGPVLTIARLVPKKGLDVLIEAFALLGAGHPELELEVVGAGPLAGELAGLTRARGVADRVHLLGPLPSREVQAAFERCSVFVLPCRIAADGDRDGMPTVLVEAMARGVPVISTDVVGISELVRDRRTGLLVQPDDPAALARAIAELLADRRLASELGVNGRALVRGAFDPARSARLLRAAWAGSEEETPRTAPRSTPPGTVYGPLPASASRSSQR